MLLARRREMRFHFSREISREELSLHPLGCISVVGKSRKDFKIWSHFKSLLMLCSNQIKPVKKSHPPLFAAPDIKIRNQTFREKTMPHIIGNRRYFLRKNRCYVLCFFFVRLTTRAKAAHISQIEGRPLSVSDQGKGILLHQLRRHNLHAY